MTTTINEIFWKNNKSSFTFSFGITFLDKQMYDYFLYDIDNYLYTKKNITPLINKLILKLNIPLSNIKLSGFRFVHDFEYKRINIALTHMFQKNEILKFINSNKPILIKKINQSKSYIQKIPNTPSDMLGGMAFEIKDKNFLSKIILDFFSVVDINDDSIYVFLTEKEIPHLNSLIKNKKLPKKTYPIENLL